MVWTERGPISDCEGQEEESIGHGVQEEKMNDELQWDGAGVGGSGEEEENALSFMQGEKNLSSLGVQIPGSRRSN